MSPASGAANDQRQLVAEPDGGFGGGTTAFFSKLDATTDAVQRQGFVPTDPLTFIKPLLDPGRLLAYLHRLLVSDVRKTGINQRGELASIESSLLQFFSKKPLRQMLRDPALWRRGISTEQIDLSMQKVEDTFSDFIDQSQHPRTGYWGPWYLMDGKLIKMHDLSYTFHIVAFRKGQVEHWENIVETTLETRKLDYPYGCKPSDNPSRYCNHHNTDVAKLFEQGFAHVGAATQTRIAHQIRTLTDWCLNESLTPAFDGFREVDDIDVVDRYAFGVQFLKIVGFWNVEGDPRPFWWDRSLPRPANWPPCRVVARNLLAAVERLKTDSSFVDDIKATLAPLRREPAVNPPPGDLRTIRRNGRSYSVGAPPQPAPPP